MQPVPFKGSKRLEGNDKNLDLHYDHGVDKSGREFILLAMQPSYEDIQAINRGEPIFIKVIGNVAPSMLLYTVDENGNCNDAG